MKLGRNFSDFIAEVDRQSDAKQDLIAKPQAITMEPSKGELVIKDRDPVPATDNAHSQIATWTGIGTRYYDKMRADNPALLAGNVNHWLHHEKNERKRRMVRTLDGKARAFLSDSYLRLDNDVVLGTMLKAFESVHSSQGLEIASCEVTDRKMYLKAVFPKIQGEVKVGDVVQMGIIGTNSETGEGRLDISAFMNRLVCDNGQVSVHDTGDGVRRTHRGSRILNQRVEYSQETIELAAKATLGEVRDAINMFTNPEYFEQILQSWRDATKTTQIQRPVKAVEVLAKQIGLTELEREGVLKALIRDGDYTKYGAMNAVTNIANTTKSYDRATELETLGDNVLRIPERRWEAIALAA